MAELRVKRSLSGADKPDLTETPPLPEVTEGDNDFIEVRDAAPTAPANPSDLAPKSRDELRGTVSRAGEIYDPAKHSYPPSETKGGKWRARRVVRDSRGLAISTSTGELPNADYRSEAEKAARTYAQLNYYALGDGAEPNEQTVEFKLLVDGIEEFYRVHGLKKLPPSVQLALGAGGYTVAAVRKTRHAKTVSSWWQRAKVRLGLAPRETKESDDASSSSR